MAAYDIVILTEASTETILVMNEVCRKNATKFIVADVRGVVCRVFNDFGPKFEVVDKNGEDL